MLHDPPFLDTPSLDETDDTSAPPPDKTALTYTAHFCPEDQDPYTMVQWKYVDVSLKDHVTGDIIFEQAHVEVPVTWSERAAMLAAQKYFYGKEDTPERETSIRQLVHRVTQRIYTWAITQQYFVSEEATQAFIADLTYLLLTQRGAFNSPVWFNLGIDTRPQQISACFINSVDDDMQSIAKLQETETIIFKQGSGSGVNLSKLRSSKERLSGGGVASGPVSFMRGYDAWAGVVKSGGGTRRAAAMRVLNADHPDILDFITCKAENEHIAQLLIKAGLSAHFDDPKGAYAVVKFQNANNSVRVTDKFMSQVVYALEHPEEEVLWELRAVMTGEILEKVPVLFIWDKICQATWSCGDPGLQFDTTHNAWNTVPSDGRINATNPCQPEFASVLTPEGIQTFADIEKGSVIWSGKQWTTVLQKRMTGVKPVFCYHTRAGIFVGTHEHRVVSNGIKIAVCETKTIDRAPLPDEKRPADPPPSSAIERVVYLGMFPVWDIEVEAEEHTYWTGGLLVSNCSEFTHLDNSACNLASLNLMRFRTADGSLNIEDLRVAASVFIIAQDILIDPGDYPTPLIKENSKRFRPLGLGYANLGAYLMSIGLPYDSDAGRQLASEITSIITSQAYLTSAQLAQVRGPFEAYERNRAAMLRVIKKHTQAAQDRGLESVSIWDEALELGEEVGFRNDQVTLCAPTGTIGMLMDCDTTGMEPDISLYKVKSLVGGGTLVMENRIVEMALEKLTYHTKTRKDIMRYLAQHKHLDGCNHLLKEHLPIFDCAAPSAGSRVLSPQAHIQMLGAVQPFVSGAISKTVNLPHNATVETISETYLHAWRLGVKNVAIYRDNCKKSQPLITAAAIKEEAPQPIILRRKLQEHQTNAHRIRFHFSDVKGYIIVSPYEETGMPGEIFIRLSKEGSTIQGLVDGWAQSLSYCLQYGVPLEILVSKFSHTKFEPCGYSSDPDIRFAHSIYDAVVRKLAAVFLNKAISNGKVEDDEDEMPRVNSPYLTMKSIDSPPCTRCGDLMQRNGTCYLCPTCGVTSGCS